MKMDVLIVCTQMERAGAQKTALLLAQALQRAGRTCRLVVLYDKAGLVAEMARTHSVEIITLEMKVPGERNPLRRVWRFLRGLARLWRLLRRQQPQVVQSFCYFSNILVCPLAWMARVPCRVASQRVSMEGVSRRVALLERWVLNSRAVQRIVAVSEGTRDFAVSMQGVRPGKILVIPNGVDVEAYRREGRLDGPAIARWRASLDLGDGPILLTVGRLHPQKGIDTLLRALPRVLRAQSQARLLIVGEGEDRDPLVALAAGLGVSHAVRFIGNRDDVANLMALADLLVSPSRWEGFPNVILEAMAARLPVIATAIGGTRELVRHGVNGWLTPVEDAGALAGGIIGLLADSSGRERLSREGYETVVSRFTLAGAMEAYMALYEGMMARHGGAS